MIAARRIGEETVIYVANIYKYYFAINWLKNSVLKKKRSAAAALRPFPSLSRVSPITPVLTRQRPTRACSCVTIHRINIAG